jgi:hypothetical protein
MVVVADLLPHRIRRIERRSGWSSGGDSGATANSCGGVARRGCGTPLCSDNGARTSACRGGAAALFFVVVREGEPTQPTSTGLSLLRGN